MTYPCARCNMDEGSPVCLQDERCPKPRHSANQCEHGQLARVCLTCEHEAKIAALTAEIARLKKDSEIDSDTITACGHKLLELDRITAERDALQAKLTESALAYLSASGQAQENWDEVLRLREELERWKETWLGWNAKRAALEADAERYRWLRDKARSVDWTQDINGWSWEQHCRIGGQVMDAAIDAALKENQT